MEEETREEEEEPEKMDDEGLHRRFADPFMAVPLEVTLHILTCLVRPTPAPTRGDRFGGPYESAVESAVSLLRLPLVSKWWRSVVRAEEEVLWARAWNNLCMSLPRGCYDTPPLSRGPLALQVARLALRGRTARAGGDPLVRVRPLHDPSSGRTPKEETINHLQILQRRKTGDILSITKCKSQVSGQCDTWNGLVVHVSPHGFLIYDLESGELQRELLIPWAKEKGRALCAVFRPNGKSVHILGLAYTDLNSRALQLHVFDLETASPGPT